MLTRFFPSTAVARRLFPLYIAAFFQGFVLWYAVEKLFMRTIGFDDAGIGAATAAYSALLILVETPSGILADRWSRKGVLILGSLMLVLSSLICGLSTTPLVFIIGTLLWGVFFAMYSGTYDSIVYDTLIEEKEDVALYDKYYGYIRFYDSIALVLGSLIGGTLSHFGLRGAFFWTIPLAAASIIALWFFKEPRIHKSEPLGKVTEHVTETFKAVLGKKSLVTLLATLVCVGLLLEILFDFYQLWLLAIGTRSELYGVVAATLTLSLGAAGLIAAKVRRRHTAALLSTISVVTGSVLLLFSKHISLIMAAQFAIGIGATTLSILLTKDLHDTLPSRVRAGASSAVNTLSRIIFVPVSLAFGALSARSSVFVACSILVVVAITTLLFQAAFTKQQKN